MCTCLETVTRTVFLRVVVSVFIWLNSSCLFGATVEIEYVWLFISIPQGSTLSDVSNDINNRGDLSTNTGTIAFEIKKHVEASVSEPAYLEAKLEKPLEIEASQVAKCAVRLSGEKLHFCPQGSLEYRRQGIYGIVQATFVARPGWIPVVDTFPKEPLRVMVSYKGCSSSQVTNILSNPPAGPAFPAAASLKFDLIYEVSMGQYAFPFERIDLSQIRKSELIYYTNQIYGRARWLTYHTNQDGRARRLNQQRRSAPQKDVFRKVIEEEKEEELREVIEKERPLERVTFRAIQ